MSSKCEVPTTQAHMTYRLHNILPRLSCVRSITTKRIKVSKVANANITSNVFCSLNLSYSANSNHNDYLLSLLIYSSIVLGASLDCVVGHSDFYAGAIGALIWLSSVTGSL